jgi:type I restriction enzyme S subunit
MLEKLKIGDICNIATGKLDANQFVLGGQYPFYTCAPEPSTIDSYAFDDSVILIAGNNAAGNFHVNRFNGKFNAYQRTYVLTEKLNFDLNYIFYSLKLELKRLKEKAQGSQTKFLTMPILNDISIPKLDLKSQQKIAAVLSSLDSKIELNNKINAKLEAMAKTLYDYWFVQFDFPDSDGKPYKTSGGKMVWNDELKREIPDGWEVKKIGEISTIKAGGDKPSIFSAGKTESCQIPIYSNGINNDGLYGYTNEATINSQCVTISARGTIGYSVLRNQPFVPIIRLIVITPHISGSAKYFYEFINGIEFEKSGSVQQQLTSPQVSQIDILYPPIDILRKFETATSSGVSEFESLREQNQTLSELRDWLLPMLMNGQVKV